MVLLPKTTGREDMWRFGQWMAHTADSHLHDDRLLWKWMREYGRIMMFSISCYSSNCSRQWSLLHCCKPTLIETLWKGVSCCCYIDSTVLSTIIKYILDQVSIQRAPIALSYTHFALIVSLTINKLFYLRLVMLKFSRSSRSLFSDSISWMIGERYGRSWVSDVSIIQM